jgi:hypothetical protein
LGGGILAFRNTTEKTLRNLQSHQINKKQVRHLERIGHRLGFGRAFYVWQQENLHADDILKEELGDLSRENGK